MSAPTPDKTAAGGLSPGSEQVRMRALALLVGDTAPWPHGWAAWRIRFAYDNGHRGFSFRDVGAFLHEAVVPHCNKRAECADTTLYLLDGEDVRRIFQAFGGLSFGRGSIAAIQSQDAYLQARQFAEDLATAGAAEQAEDAEVLALPDLSWDVMGFGQSRVATAHARGYRVVVRLGMLAGREMWMVDVNGHPGCARFRVRLDAMSKMGVAAALKSYELRLRRQP